MKLFAIFLSCQSVKYIFLVQSVKLIFYYFLRLLINLRVKWTSLLFFQKFVISSLPFSFLRFEALLDQVFFRFSIEPLLLVTLINLRSKSGTFEFLLNQFKFQVLYLITPCTHLLHAITVNPFSWILVRLWRGLGFRHCFIKDYRLLRRSVNTWNQLGWLRGRAYIQWRHGLISNPWWVLVWLYCILRSCLVFEGRLDVKFGHIHTDLVAEETFDHLR